MYIHINEIKATNLEQKKKDIARMNGRAIFDKKTN